MKTIVELEAVVLIVPVFFIEPPCVVCATHTLFLAILVDAPKVFNTVDNCLLIAVLAKEVRGHCKESDVLNLELENGCIKYGHD